MSEKQQGPQDEQEMQQSSQREGCSSSWQLRGKLDLDPSSGMSLQMPAHGLHSERFNATTLHCNIQITSAA